MKTCSKCKESKTLDSFSRNKSAPDGHHWWCKACNNPYQRASYLKRRPQALERKRVYNRENRGKEQARKNLYYRQRAQEIMTLLGSECSICGIKDKRVLQIDHIHGGGTQHRKKLNNAWWKILGEVRDSVKNGELKYRLLCANCNWIEAVKNGHRKSIWSDEALAAIR